MSVNNTRLFPVSFVAPVVQASLQAASIILRQASESALKVLTETATLQGYVDDITTKYNAVVTATSSASTLITQARNSGKYDSVQDYSKAGNRTFLSLMFVNDDG